MGKKDVSKEVPSQNSFVITDREQILVQIIDANRWGFSLADDDQTWPGGHGAARSWDLIAADDPRITADDHERLDWLIDWPLGGEWAK